MAAKSFGQWVRPKIAGMARSYVSINWTHLRKKLSAKGRNFKTVSGKPAASAVRFFVL